VAEPEDTARAPGSTVTGHALAEGPVWLHAFPLGEFHHPMYGRLVFTRERLQRFADNIRRRIRGIDLAIDYEHGQDLAKGRRAAGWIVGAQVRADGLWLLARFTDEARREIHAGHWRYLSPDYQDEWTDARGQRWRDVLFGAALTNRADRPQRRARRWPPAPRRRHVPARPAEEGARLIAGSARSYGRRWNQAIEAAAPSSSRSAAPPMNSDVSSRFSST
jgi:Mu-like prophage I protein